MELKKATLLLQDGTVFQGNAVGAIGTTTGEIAFNTGMTGYQEIFTDPSYFGQLVVMATAHIGNYGVNNEEVESDSVKISGLICKKFSDSFSRAKADSSLRDYFIRDNIVGISDIDTRLLVKHIRDKGAMNAVISSEVFDVAELKKILEKVPSMEGLELSSKVSTKAKFTVGANNAGPRIALIDFGVKKSIINCLIERGCVVTVFPHNTTLDELVEFKPDGFLLSNGPGDPSVMSTEIDMVAGIINLGLPVFGICLGHQLLALSQGLKTKKMHNGHRGINHPVKNLITGSCEITSQNHGFVVDNLDSEKNRSIDMTHIHLHDNTLAGLRLKGRPVFSVQYHPEASPGPHDSRYLFDEFLDLVLAFKKQAINA